MLLPAPNSGVTSVPNEQINTEQPVLNITTSSNDMVVPQETSVAPVTPQVVNNIPKKAQARQNLAIKYRPKTWDDVCEQDAIKQILSNELKLGNLKRCMLFTGGAGTGKTTSARIFANMIETTRANIVEINCADHTGVDDVRQLIIEPSQVKPLAGTYKIFILDESHMLTVQSQNALLKLLEEPPAYCIYIMCTTDPQKVLPTIMSRSVRYDFQLISQQGIVNRLNYILNSEKADPNGLTIENWDDAALEMLALSSAGHMRNAVVGLEKVLSFSNTVSIEAVEKVLGVTSFNILFDMLDCLIAKDQVKLLAAIDELVKSGMDLRLFVKNFLAFVLEVNKYVILRTSNTDKPMEYLTLPSSFESRLSAYSAPHKGFLKQLLRMLLDLNSSLRWETNVKPVLETNLLLAIM